MTTLQFGWVLPPGYNAAKDDATLRAHGCAGDNLAAHWEPAIRRVLETISGQWDSAWLTDHFFWPDGDCLEALSALAFYAALTPKLRWGTMVLGQGYRNPALTAKMASTIHYLSGGRFICGIGAGWKKDEYEAYGYPFPTPGRRVAELEDTVTIIKRMWAEASVTHAGKYLSVAGAINQPQAPGAPVLMIGGGGEQKMLPLVARHADWWNSGTQGEVRTRKVEILQRECAAIGRDFASLRNTWFGGVTVGHTQDEVQRRLRDDFVRNNGIWGTPDEVLRKFDALAQSGVSYIMCDSRGIPEPGELELLMDVSRRV